FGGTFHRQCRMSASGIPQLAAVFGECTAGGAYIPALCDEFVMVDGAASIHLGGPQIVKAAISEVIDRHDLGGAALHALESGVADQIVADEYAAIGRLREMVGSLAYAQPLVTTRAPAIAPAHDIAELPGIIGTDLKQPVDPREIIARIV